MVSVSGAALVYCHESGVFWYHNNKPINRSNFLFVDRVMIIPMVVVESKGHYSCFKQTEVGMQFLGSSLLKVDCKCSSS